MRVVDRLRRRYGKAHITLHAGELVSGLVRPEELTRHIREAVLVGRVERVGHAVDVLHEDGWPEPVRTLRERQVMVEKPLTGDDRILEVSGAEHPFPTHRAFGVPIASATDDEGISRTDPTRECARATTAHRLGYRGLKRSARTSLDHSVLDGARLRRGPDEDVPTGPGTVDRVGAAEPSEPGRSSARVGARTDVSCRDSTARSPDRTGTCDPAPLPRLAPRWRCPRQGCHQLTRVRWSGGAASGW